MSKKKNKKKKIKYPKLKSQYDHKNTNLNCKKINKKFSFTLVIICVIFIVFIIAPLVYYIFIDYSQNKNDFKFDNRLYSNKSNLPRRIFNDQIDNSISFAENFINSYFDRLFEKLNKEAIKTEDIKNPLFYASKNGISGYLVLSSVSESILYLYPNDSCKLHINLTSYPSNLYFFTNSFEEEHNLFQKFSKKFSSFPELMS